MQEFLAAFTKLWQEVVGAQLQKYIESLRANFVNVKNAIESQQCSSTDAKENSNSSMLGKIGKVFGGGDDARNANNQVVGAKGKLDFEFARDLKEIMVGFCPFNYSLASGNRHVILMENV